MEVIKINPKNPSKKAIAKAALIIKNGGVVIYPTDTCYGLAVSAFDKKAIDKLFILKKRLKAKPISVIVDLKMLERFFILDQKRKKMVQKFLPGPFTFILPLKASIALKGLFKELSSRNTLGIRIPDNLLCLKLVQKLKIPFTTTSANLSGQKPPYSISEIKIKPDLILDAGKLPKNPPSTVVDLTYWPPLILRVGGQNFSMGKERFALSRAFGP